MINEDDTVQLTSVSDLSWTEPTAALRWKRSDTTRTLQQKWNTKTQYSCIEEWRDVPEVEDEG